MRSSLIFSITPWVLHTSFACAPSWMDARQPRSEGCETQANMVILIRVQHLASKDTQLSDWSLLAFSQLWAQVKWV